MKAKGDTFSGTAARSEGVSGVGCPVSGAGARRGFTLLEVLVAMVILVWIVLMMSLIFKRSADAWRTGTRRIELNLQGRAALNLMAHEIAHAVADEVLADGLISDGASTISFYTLGSSSTTNRCVRLLTYALDGDGVLWRTVQDVGVETEYPELLPARTHPVAPNVDRLVFETPEFGTYTTNLPRWVDITLEMSRGGTVGNVAARSFGPDEADGTDDDITTEESE